MAKIEKELVQELIEDAARDFDSKVRNAMKKFEVSIPQVVFQEKHTSGYLWWKRTWYTYHRYSEGQMLGLSSYSYATIKSFERGK